MKDLITEEIVGNKDEQDNINVHKVLAILEKHRVRPNLVLKELAESMKFKVYEWSYHDSDGDLQHHCCLVFDVLENEDMYELKNKNYKIIGWFGENYFNILVNMYNRFINTNIVKLPFSVGSITYIEVRKWLDINSYNGFGSVGFKDISEIKKIQETCFVVDVKDYKIDWSNEHWITTKEEEGE